MKLELKNVDKVQINSSFFLIGNLDTSECQNLKSRNCYSNESDVIVEAGYLHLLTQP